MMIYSNVWISCIYDIKEKEKNLNWKLKILSTINSPEQVLDGSDWCAIIATFSTYAN